MSPMPRRPSDSPRPPEKPTSRCSGKIVRPPLGSSGGGVGVGVGDGVMEGTGLWTFGSRRASDSPGLVAAQAATISPAAVTSMTRCRRIRPSVPGRAGLPCGGLQSIMRLGQQSAEWTQVEPTSPGPCRQPRPCLVRRVPDRAGVATLIAHDDDQSAHLAPRSARPPPPDDSPSDQNARSTSATRAGDGSAHQAPQRILRWARLRGVR
jgi:hypothetical protein